MEGARWSKTKYHPYLLDTKVRVSLPREGANIKVFLIAFERPTYNLIVFEEVTEVEK